MLVSLAVLGLIAGLTVPSIINSVETSRKKAIFKESLNIIKTLGQDYILNNTPAFAENGVGHPYVNYIFSRMNVVKDCSKHGQTVSTSGCAASTYTVANTHPAFNYKDLRGSLLASGALIMTTGGSGSNDGIQLGISIDWNGDKPPNAIGKDTVAFQYVLAPNPVGGRNVGSTYPNNGTGGQAETDNTALWDWINN